MIMNNLKPSIKKRRTIMKTSRHNLTEKLNANDTRRTINNALKGIISGLALLAIIGTTSVPGTMSSEEDGTALVVNSPNSYTVKVKSSPSNNTIEPAFCLDGEVMQQLLQGFGSSIPGDELVGLKLNCGTRILREEAAGDNLVLDIELECECVDPDGEPTELDSVQGQWTIKVGSQEIRSNSYSELP
jgi:hypothetical protein